MGFDVKTKDGHRVYWPEKRAVSVERSVKFNFEPNEVIVGALPLKGEYGGDDNDERKVPDEILVPETRTEPEPAVKSGRGKCIRKETEYVRLLREGMGVVGGKTSGVLPRGMQLGTSVVTGDGPELTTEVDYAMVMVIESAEGLTPTYEEACKHPNWPKWKIAIQTELNNLEKSGTWSLVKQPPGANVVNCQWVFQIKKNAAREVEKYKARLVAKGFTQIYSINYYESYAPVAKLVSFQIILAIAAKNEWVMDTFDFDSVYLNSKLGDDDVIYLEQPVGHETKNWKEYVWRLLKTLYGLKQGVKNWYDTLYQVLVKLGFKRTEVDHGMFYKQTGKDTTVLAIHVNDCMVTRNSEVLISKFKADMNKKYRLTDLGPANWLLGIKINCNLANKKVFLSQ